MHADMEIVQAAAACFKQKIEEIEVRATEGRAVRTAVDKSGGGEEEVGGKVEEKRLDIKKNVDKADEKRWARMPAARAMHPRLNFLLPNVIPFRHSFHRVPIFRGNSFVAPSFAPEMLAVVQHFFMYRSC